MKDWKHTPNHRIAGTEHGRLHFADGTVTVLADWQVLDDAPDPEGRIYRTLRGWAATWTDPEPIPGDMFPPPPETPFPKGRAHLLRAELRGQPPLTDRDVYCFRTNVFPPEPNTWDHPGLLLSMMWLDRHLDPDGDTTAPPWWPLIHQRIGRHSPVLADLLNHHARPIADGDVLWLRLDPHQEATVRAEDGEKLIAWTLRHPGSPRATRRIELGAPAQPLTATTSPAAP